MWHASGHPGGGNVGQMSCKSSAKERDGWRWKTWSVENEWERRYGRGASLLVFADNRLYAKIRWQVHEQQNNTSDGTVSYMTLGRQTNKKRKIRLGFLVHTIGESVICLIVHAADITSFRSSNMYVDDAYYYYY